MQTRVSPLCTKIHYIFHNIKALASLHIRSRHHTTFTFTHYPNPINASYNIFIDIIQHICLFSVDLHAYLRTYPHRISKSNSKSSTTKNVRNQPSPVQPSLPSTITQSTKQASQTKRYHQTKHPTLKTDHGISTWGIKRGENLYKTCCAVCKQPINS